MIRYSCPKCKAGLAAQDHEGGTKIHCPRCNQRLQIPTPTQPATTDNRTVLGKMEEQANKTVLGKPEDLDNRTVLGKQDDPVVLDPAEPREPPPKRRSSKGTIVVKTQPPADEPEEDDDDDGAFADFDKPPSRRSRRRERGSQRLVCPYCNSDAPRRSRRTLTTMSWILLILLIWTFPLCLLALLITEDGDYCGDCGTKLGTRGTSFGIPG